MSIKDKILDSAKEISKYLAVKKVYDKFFSRYDRPNYAITPGLVCIDRCNLNRIDISFNSNNYLLKGYYYPNNSNKLVVVCHGLRSGSDDYLPFINYFINNGYECFSFNYKGTYESEGKGTVGMSESLVDLDNALKYIKKDNLFKNKDIYLFGHSWGGFAVCSVLSLHNNIKAVASISGFNDAATMIVDKGVFYVGEVAALPKEYIDSYQYELFKDYLKYNAVMGINNTNAKILLAHGNNDMVVDYINESIMSKANYFINNNVSYYIGKDYNNGHESILYSKEANEYQKEVKRQIKKLKNNEEELKIYISNVDHYKYSEINEELFKKIINTFK